MGLAPETIESVDLMAKRLDEWATRWGRRLRDVKSNDLGEFRKVLLAASSHAEFRSVAFMTEFHSGLAKALSDFDRVHLELVHNVPRVAGEIRSLHQQLFLEAGWVRDLSDETHDWLKAFNRSRNTALHLAMALRRASQLAQNDQHGQEVTPRTATLLDFTDRPRTAYLSYQGAVRSSGFPEKSTYRMAYDWLEKYGCEEYPEGLPKYTTWEKYVRTVCIALGERKNKPRGGRSGRSVARVHQI